MQIVIENLKELAELVAVLDLQRLERSTSVPLRYMDVGGGLGRDEATRAIYGPSDPVQDGVQLHDALARAAQSFDERARVEAVRAAGPAALEEPSPPAPRDLGPVDATGLPWDARIHSDPPKTNKDGTWRARRGVSAETVAEVTVELYARQGDAPAPEQATEPLATETHALPTELADEPAAEPAAPTPEPASTEAASTESAGPRAAGPTQLADLVAAAVWMAPDASDSLPDLLGVAKRFIGEHGTEKLNELKAAAVPVGGDAAGVGKALQALTPGERRLLRACLDNYALYV